MKNYKFILMAVMAGFLALEGAANVFACNTATSIVSADKISDQNQAEISNIQFFSVRFNWPMMPTERLNDIRQVSQDIGAVILCEEDDAMLAVHYGIGVAKVFYVYDEFGYAVADLAYADGRTDEDFRQFLEERCAQGILENLSDRVNRTN